MLKVAVVQDSPVFFDKEATLRQMEKLVEACAQQDCQLALFPESFVPGYPRGFDFGAKVGRRTEAGKKLYARYYRESVDLDSPDRERLEKMAADHHLYLAIGLTEKSGSHGSLFCSLALISPDNGLLGVHRKIKPTGTERLIWAEAGGESLLAWDTAVGRLGGLICWENYMPLARMALYQKGVQIYLAPTADSRESWTASMRHIALEGRCFVLGCNQYFTRSMYPEDLQQWVQEEPEDMCPGGSLIVSPSGEVVAGPLYGEPGILTAEIDLEDTLSQKLDFDPAGHYHRPDIFQFSVTGQPEIQKEAPPRP